MKQHQGLFDLEVFKTIIDQIQTSVFITDKNGHIVYVNPFFITNTGYSNKEIIGKNPRILQSGEHDTAFYAELWDTVNNNKTWKGEIRNQRKDGSKFWSKVIISPIKNALGDDEYYVAMEQDVTADKEAAKVAERRQNLLVGIQSLSKTGGWEFDLKSDTTFWTNEMYRIYGIESETNSVEDFLDGIKRYHRDDQIVLQTAYSRLLQHGTPFDHTLRFRDDHGNKKWVRIKSRATFNEKNEVEKIYGSLMDVTDEIQTKESLLSAYKERGLLLAEIHHRVKNNLALISGLMQLQVMGESNEVTKSSLEISISRVNSLGFIYEQLYTSDKFGEISLSKDIRRHVDVLNRMFNRDGRIQVQMSLDDTKLHINQAIPVGLLINEILSNSYKFAFPDNRTGTIYVNLTSWENSVLLEIKDNGIGMNKKKYKEDSSVGLSIIRSLFDQLKAEVVIHVEEGVSYRISFDRRDNAGPAVQTNFSRSSEQNLDSRAM